MSDRTLSRVRAWLVSAKKTTGSKLPPERELAVLLGVSRAELRKALMLLESEGRLERKVGRGTFLAHPVAPGHGAGALGDVTALAERTGPHEAMIARLALEPELAQLAALHATPRQLSELRSLAHAMRTASSWRVYETLDSAFHDLIAQSAGNALLHEVHRIINGVRMVVVWRRLRLQDAAPPMDYHSFDEHDAIVAALEGRDRAEAKKAMRIHLKSTLGKMTEDD